MLEVWREKRAHRNRKWRNMSIVLFVKPAGNVTLDGGEGGGWGGWTESRREREMYNYTERTGPQLEDGVACALGLYHSAGVKLGCLLRSP